MSETSPHPPNEVAIRLPDLNAATEVVRVSCWLVNLNDTVSTGDRLVEVILPGLTFDISSPTCGTVCRIEKGFDSVIQAGDILGWIRPGEN